MNDEVAIRVENVSKTFKIPHEKISSLRGAFVSGLPGFFSKPSFRTGKSSALGYEEFEALNDVSFEVKKRAFFARLDLRKRPLVDARRGIIGRNDLKERGIKNVLRYINSKAKSAFFQALTEISEIAIIKLLKPPVLTARHGGVLFLQ